MPALLEIVASVVTAGAVLKIALLNALASLCFQPVAVQLRSGMVSPVERARSCPVMVSGALATVIDLATGVAANMVEFSAAVAVTVTVPPPRMMAVVPLISRMVESLDV